jgi:sterol desaturase/sphingolipid hydroxylase (fatty acid hydroxylase superfamily)
MEHLILDKAIFRTIHFIFHGVHHAFPMDKHRLVFPIVAAHVLWYPFHKVWMMTMSITMVNTFTAGFMGAYVIYDIGHYYLHHSQPLQVAEYRKKYHMYHHYKDSDNGYGITTSFWDKVFGTELDMTKKQDKGNKSQITG